MAKRQIVLIVSALLLGSSLVLIQPNANSQQKGPEHPLAAQRVEKANHSECAWDIYTVGGKYVGRLTDRGLVDHAVSGGGGAYLGVRGEHQNGPSGINPPLRRP